MKFCTATTTLLLVAQTAMGLHDEASWHSRRRLDADDAVCTYNVNHDAAQSNPEKEIDVLVKGFPKDAGGLFDITVLKGQPPWSEPTKDATHSGWCVDFSRPIGDGTYKMDIYSLVDDDLPNGITAAGFNRQFSAVDKRAHRHAVTYLINKNYVGKPWVPKGTCNPPGKSGKPFVITWWEIQGAVWKVIDDDDASELAANHGLKAYYTRRVDCISQWIADDALANGMNYEPDCGNSGELVPLAYVFDVESGKETNYTMEEAYDMRQHVLDTKGKILKEEAGQIRHQVIISETPIHEIEGMCECDFPATCADVPKFPEVRLGLPAQKYTDNPNCQQMGYDFGWKMEGCSSGDDLHFDKMKKTKGVCADGTDNVGTVDITCSDADDGAWRLATIKPDRDAVVMMKGGNGGVIYDGLKAGKEYTLDVGDKKAISHMEFCFMCRGPCESRVVPTDPPTAPPTEPPTPVPTVPPTQPPTTPPATSPPAPDQPPVEQKKGPGTYVKGDPHFKTFGGEMYDFHGECDLVLLHNPEFKNGMGMDIHIRTKIEDFWSSVESAALQIGDATMEIQANPESDEWLWVNGESVTVGLEVGKWHHAEIGGFLLRYKETTPVVREANVYLETGHKEYMVFKTFKSFVRIDVDWEKSVNYIGSTGLLGSFDLDGLRVARDGVTPLADTMKFGQEWQVLDSESKLFHSYDNAVVGRKCLMPPAYTAETAARMKRRLRASKLTEADAKKACEHLKDPEEIQSCVFDVIATQDLSMASVW